MNIRSVFKMLSLILLFVSMIMLIPLFIALGNGEAESLKAFSLTIGIILTFCLLIFIATHKKNFVFKFGVKESYLFVTLTWVFITLFGALPLFFRKVLPTYSASFFEIMSGFTTTGATAINDIESVDKSLLFWRNITNWLGGMGIVVLFIAVLPSVGAKGAAIVGAESVGPTKDKLTPKIRHTALYLWLIYIGLSILEVIFLLFGGIGLFNALTVTFGTMGAAGFTPTNLSIASFNSPYVEWVCIVFMFLAGGNFALYFKALRGQVKNVIKDGELRLYFSIIMGASLLVSLNLILQAGLRASDAIRGAFFQVISFITTTGFSSTSYQHWPVFSQAILLLLCFVGGCAGSAGGGMKVVRIGTISRLGINSIKRRLYPNAVIKTKVGGESVDSSVITSICGFIGAYLITLFLSTVVISLSGQDLLTCFSSCILTLGNIGIGLGGIGMDFTFSVYPEWCLWVFSFLMLVGRLELFTVYSLFSKKFWQK